MLNFTATQKPEMNHEKYPVFPSHENGFPRGYNHPQSIFIHFSSTRLYNLQDFFQYFGSHSPTVQLWLSFPNLIREVAAPHLRLPFLGSRTAIFRGKKRGGNPQLLWSLVAMLGITEIGHQFFKMYSLVMADIAMENGP